MSDNNPKSQNLSNCVSSSQQRLVIQLSDEQKRCIDFIKKHEKIIRYKGGFWAEENAELKPGYNGGRIEYYYPENHFGTNTIKSLIKKGVILVSKYKHNQYRNNDYPVECILKVV